MQNKPLILTLLVGIALSGAAQAALESRLGGLAVYDTDLNLTWLADDNYAKTSGYDVDGLMDWTAANAWAAGLSYGGYSGWRLPTADPACGANYNCTGSEMGHLFYSELGGTAGLSILGSSALFTNIQFGYWSGTVYAPNPNDAWDFAFGLGDQGSNSKGSLAFAWAVRPGDVAAVPIPAAAWLLGSGLLGLIGVARRQRMGA